MATVKLEIVGVGTLSKTLSAAHTQRLVAAYKKRLQEAMVPNLNPTNQEIFEAWARDLLNHTVGLVRNMEAEEASSGITNIDFA